MEGEIKEKRGGPLNKAGVRAVVSPKEKEKKGKWGGPVRGRGARVGSRPDTRKGATHSAQRWCALHDVTVMRKRDDNGPDIDGIHRARSEITRHA